MTAVNMKKTTTFSLMVATLACCVGFAVPVSASVGTAGATVTILAAGGVSQAGSLAVNGVPLAGANATPVVSFEATTGAMATTAIMLPSEVTLTRVGSLDTLKLESFTQALNTTFIGANIIPSADQLPGTYVGTVAIGVAFN
jgi:hypothetical protein